MKHEMNKQAAGYFFFQYNNTAHSSSFCLKNKRLGKESKRRKIW